MQVCLAGSPWDLFRIVDVGHQASEPQRPEIPTRGRDTRLRCAARSGSSLLYVLGLEGYQMLQL